MLQSPPYLWGVDFSGAVDAGRKIHLSRAFMSDGGLSFHGIEMTYTGSLSRYAASRDSAYATLRTLITSQDAAVWGFDFPFSLSSAMIPYPAWRDFILHFARDYPTPEAFYQAGRQLKPPPRRTDIEAKTPFTPHNLRLFRQTYYGIRDLLAPLVAADQVWCPPMTWGAEPRPILIEVCPASFLKRWNLYQPYKGKSAAHRDTRAAIVKTLCNPSADEVKMPAYRRTFFNRMRMLHGSEPLLDDPEGDALDSVIASYATACVYYGGELGALISIPDPVYRLEGYVFGAS